MSDSSEHTTAVLLGRIRQGDSNARRALVARAEPLLQRFARGRLPQLLRHEQDTADLVQLTWLKVLEKLEHIESREPGAFYAYLRTVLLNALRESLRRNQRSPLETELSDEVANDIPAANVQSDDWLAYEQALATLSDDQRALVLMRFEFGMSFVEIAQELDQRPDAIRMRLNRTLAQMAHGQASSAPQ